MLKNIFFKNLNFKNFSHLKISFPKYNFSTKLNIDQIKQKLEKENSVKIYESNYPFLSEKLTINGSMIFSLIFGSTILFTSVPLWMKLINAIAIVPCILIQIEYFSNKVRFIKSVRIEKGDIIVVYNMYNKKEVLYIKDLNKVANDKRYDSIKNKLNDEIFIIFTNKNNNALYYVPREGIFINDELFHNIIEGKPINTLI